MRLTAAMSESFTAEVYSIAYAKNTLPASAGKNMVCPKILRKNDLT
ncbi:MAG: hypothetical protein GX996_09285 [Firmicutes bacterium]|nr:hypothetical protein [Bacillota bacterium]